MAVLHTVIIAERIFKGEVEFVFAANHFVAFRTRDPMSPVPRAGHIPASAINIHLDVFLQLASVFLSPAVCVAVRYHPSYRVLLIG